MLTEEIKQRAYELLRKNRRVAQEHQFTVPSPTSYPYQWLWDSCFHAIVLAHFSIDDAKKELLSLVAHQFENGMIPHMTYWERTAVLDIDWGREKTSSITQPPLVAYAAWVLYQKDQDRAFLERIYPNLYHYYTYLLSERDPRRNHLIGIINPDESGEDNSPRFDKPLGLPPRHTMEENTRKRMELMEKNKSCKFDAPFCMKNFFWVKDVPFNVICAKSLQALSRIAETLDRKDEALIFQEAHLEIMKAMRERMFEDGCFWSTYGEGYKKLKVKTWAIFAPLFSGLLSQEEADTLVKDHLLNKDEFWTPYPVPTVAKNEPSYEPLGFWRGPTWMAVNWLLFRGLMSYGFHDIAQHIFQQSLALIQKSGFREYFHPETGEGGGAHDFTWGTLIVDME